MLGLDAQFSIISYAVVSTKYESNQNLLHSFLPLVEHVLSVTTSNYVSKKDVMELFYSIYGYEIPPAVFDEFFRILRNQKKIDFLKNDHIEIYRDNIYSLEEDDAYKLSMRKLVADFVYFNKKRGQAVDDTSVVNSFLKFIINNAVEFNSFIKYEESSFSENDLEQNIVDFLFEERNNQTSNYVFLQDIYYGVVLASLLASHKDDEPLEFDFSYNIENMLLDSNFIFRLIDLQTDFEHAVALDTFNKLKRINCKFWIAKDTIKQIADTIIKYIAKSYDGTSIIYREIGENRFAGLHSAIIRRGLSKAKLNKIVENLEKTLVSTYKICILEDDALTTLNISNDDKIELYDIKPDANETGIIHDLRLIQYVKKMRSPHIFSMSQAKWWLLTDDLKLTKWNIKSQQNTGVPECITESQIATVLWLNEPQNLSNDSLYNTIIALRNRRLIGNSDFDKLVTTIERQKIKYGDSEEDLDKLSLIFSQRLINLDDVVNGDIAEVDELFENSMQKAKQILDERDELLRRNEDLSKSNNKMSAELNEQKNTATAIIDSQKSLLTQETIDHIETLKKLRIAKEHELSKTKDHKKQKNTSRNKKIKLISVLLTIILVCISIFVAYKIQPLLNDWFANNQVFVWLIPFIIPVSILGLSFKLSFKVVKGLFWILTKLRIVLDINDFNKKSDEQILKIEAELLDLQNKIEDKLNKS